MVSNSIVISEFKRNDIICRHGQLDNLFHIIIAGEVKALMPTEDDYQFELFKLGAGDFFGEDLILSNEPRENTLLAVEDTMTISMTKDVLDRLSSGSETIKTLIDKQYIKRKLEADLRSVSIFTYIDDNIFKEILNKVELLTIPKGTVIFNEGDKGDTFYLIRNGRVNVKSNVNGEKKLLNILTRGQFFGEISLLLQDKRSATVEVAVTSDLVKISSGAFMEIVKKDEMLMDKLLGIVKERKKRSDEILEIPRIAVVTRRLLDLNNILYRHLDIISQCAIYTDKGSALLATFPDSRYPYVYIRDSACASRFLYKLLVSPLKAGGLAFRLLREVAKFILNCQTKEGFWGQRYGINGEDKSIYKQEDNVAHGVTILCRYLLAAKYRKENVPDIERIIEAIGKGAEYARMHYYRKGIHLFYSTTSIHESAIEKGYSIWVNFAYLLMVRLIERVGIEYSVTNKFMEELALKSAFESTIDNVFTVSNRFVRRLKPDGDVDIRPDITLMSPFYFGTGMDSEYFANTDKFINSIEFIEKTLWDPVLEMLQRYLAFVEDPHTHIHAGNGPWLQYTAIMAQYYFYVGKVKRGNEILDIIDKYRSQEGYLCEHLTTPERFYEFRNLEWITGKDFEKELLVQEIMLPHITYDFVVEELNHMKKEYDTIEKECQWKSDREPISFATPLMWSHVEYAMALMLKTEKEVENLESQNS